MGSKEFKMPLHYPRYTKKEYQEMPEWMLDRLLAEYGLPVVGNLEQKRHFAMGAFLWPNNATKTSNCYSNNANLVDVLRKKNV
ncbi:hypothetical protein CDL12_19499 [Handroanthus impetiginosus]|uniref:DUF7722 domain-containing protein n=1 Tax=Handroanthus impetiginosus TaxID=429701 RepID=A0A2G9GRU1_9LAMI|nr:hypothetical protein CDL12_19499 [Handroanthus impetiginosus]